jgi:hypothetical protein
MSADNRAVYHSAFHIRIIGKMSQHSFPNPGFTPAHEAFLDTVPIAILHRQQTPLRSTSAHPFHRLDKAATGLLVLAEIRIRVFSQEIPHLLPLFVG